MLNDVLIVDCASFTATYVNAKSYVRASAIFFIGDEMIEKELSNAFIDENLKIG